jgi:hypothetical protein
LKFRDDLVVILVNVCRGGRRAGIVDGVDGLQCA